METSLKYSINEIVFARCRSDPFWPAKIIKILPDYHVYQVSFYNHQSTAYIEERDLLPFQDEIIKKQKKSILNKMREHRLLQRTRVMIIKGIQIAKQELNQTAFEHQNQKNQETNKDKQRQLTLELSFEAMKNRKRSFSKTIDQQSSKKRKLNQQKQEQTPSPQKNDVITRQEMSSNEIKQQNYSMEHAEYNIQRKFSKLLKRQKHIKQLQQRNKYEREQIQSLRKNSDHFQQNEHHHHQHSRSQTHQQIHKLQIYAFPFEHIQQNHQAAEKGPQEQPIIQSIQHIMKPQCQIEAIQHKSLQVQNDRYVQPDDAIENKQQKVECNDIIKQDEKPLVQDVALQDENQSEKLQKDEEKDAIVISSVPITQDKHDKDKQILKNIEDFYQQLMNMDIPIYEKRIDEQKNPDINGQQLQNKSISSISPQNPQQNCEMKSKCSKQEGQICENLQIEMVNNIIEKGEILSNQIKPAQYRADFVQSPFQDEIDLQNQGINDQIQKSHSQPILYSESLPQIHDSIDYNSSSNLNLKHDEQQLHQSELLSNQINSNEQCNQIQQQQSPICSDKSIENCKVLEINKEIDDLESGQMVQNNIRQNFIQKNLQFHEASLEEQIQSSNYQMIQSDKKLNQKQAQIIQNKSDKPIIEQNLEQQKEESKNQINLSQFESKNSINSPQRQQDNQYFVPNSNESSTKPKQAILNIEQPLEDNVSVVVNFQKSEQNDEPHQQKPQPSIKQSEFPVLEEKADENLGVQLKAEVRQQGIEREEKQKIGAQPEQMAQPMEIQENVEPQNDQLSHHSIDIKINLQPADDSSMQEELQSLQGDSNPVYDVLCKKINWDTEISNLKQLYKKQFNTPSNYSALIRQLPSLQRRLKDAKQTLLISHLKIYNQQIISYLSSKSNDTQRLLTMAQRQMYLAILTCQKLTPEALSQEGILEEFTKIIQLCEDSSSAKRSYINNYSAEFLMVKAKLTYFKFLLKDLMRNEEDHPEQAHRRSKICISQISA